MSTSKVLLVSNAGWNLYNYRLPIVRALQHAGVDVGLVCPRDHYAEALEQAGFNVIEWRLERRSLNPLGEALAVRRLARIYRDERPDLVHHFTIKPNVYGVMAARLARDPHVINTWTGLGFIFNRSAPSKILRLVATPALRWVARSPRVWSVYQTPADLDLMARLGFADRDRSSVIFGSGVDTESFSPQPMADAQHPIVLMASRLLREKGVREFVEATRILKSRGTPAVFELAGAPDPGNPNSFTGAQVERLRNEPTLTYLGHRSDMPSLLREASIAVLPTYYNEGIPRFLLEATATGIPVVAADTPGCSEAVDNEVSGLLVPPRDPTALADAMERLIEDPSLRTRMGERGRAMAIERFDEKLIVREYLDIYRAQGLLPVAER